jgi:hypothetical protein
MIFSGGINVGPLRDIHLESPKWPEDDRRINNIAVNGGTGEHYTALEQAEGLDSDPHGRIDITDALERHNASEWDRLHGLAAEKQVGGEHYSQHKIQPWDVIDEYNLDFYEGNVLKYLLRDKGSRREDLEKAMHYLEKKLEGMSNG